MACKNTNEYVDRHNVDGPTVFINAVAARREPVRSSSGDRDVLEMRLRSGAARTPSTQSQDATPGLLAQSLNKRLDARGDWGLYYLRERIRRSASDRTD
jgi:hypothetical protein